MRLAPFPGPSAPATGGPGGERSSSLRGLTAKELQVALVVAEGATNEGAAAALFVSPKTIGFHPGKVYREFGLRSRAELVRRIVSTTSVMPDLATGTG